MGRASRTFKLRLSPAGMNLLIDAHCYLIRSTRKLLPWGTTLHVAVAYLETVPDDELGRAMSRLAVAELAGSEVHFLGAPYTLNEIAGRIVERLRDPVGVSTVPTLLQTYLVALQTLLSADAEALRLAYDRVSGQATTV